MSVTCNTLLTMKSKANTPPGTRKPESASRVRRYREALRTQGLKQVTHWVPDTRRGEFLTEYRRQLAVLAKASDSFDWMNWLDEVRCTEGWV